MVEKSVKKLLEVIKDLTNFSRNARLEIMCELINFQSLINESIDSLNFLENANRITFNINIDDNAASFYSDKLRISILLNNIISNAIIYHNIKNDYSYINITVKINNTNAKISIQDNGNGIEMENIEKIFGMFFRASTASGGSGLGLYIVKGILEKLDGSIEVNSTVGYGSEFIFTIPNIACQNGMPQQTEIESSMYLLT